MAFVTMLKPEERKDANINTVKMLLYNAEYRIQHCSGAVDSDLLAERDFYRGLYDELLAQQGLA